MNQESVISFPEAERRLVFVASVALDVQTPRATRARVGQLLHLSHVFLPVVGELEGTDDPVEIARRSLLAAARDSRINNDFPEIDPTDAYSQTIAKRQERLGYALGVLSRQAQNQPTS
jgi:hypothetical protein